MLTLSNPDGEVYFPTGDGNEQQLSRTTHLGIGAHQDDLEIMAIHGILKAYDDPNLYFTGVTVTDGRGSPRPDAYKDLNEDSFWRVRCSEQKKAADLGRYNAQFLLNYRGQHIKYEDRCDAIEDLKQILKATTPSVIYTHNPADKHDTHVAVLLCVIQALRELDPPLSDVRVLGCEVWRGLDWMCDNEKIPLDVSKHIDLQKALLQVFDSQVSGGKRYDLAAIGHRNANATYFESHRLDEASRIVYAMDLTPLISKPDLPISSYITSAIQNLERDVLSRLDRLQGS